MKSGDGGNGIVSFRRERCVPEGGPDGGDGGDGGNVVFLVDKNKETLIDFVNHVHFKAEPGVNGRGAKCYGKCGQDLIIRIPLGTEVWDEARKIMYFDAIKDGQKFVMCHGGKGGIGNAKFVSSTNQTPKYAKVGTLGEEMWLWLVLKIFADIGYVGFPNAGKSSLLKLLTGSSTKVANYPFTTLAPELGTLWKYDQKLIMADLPGIISGAHQNKGLGLQFLGHIERCYGVLHIIDISVENCRDALASMLFEIEQFSPILLEKKQIIALNKIDLVSSQEVQEQIKEINDVYDFPVYPISCTQKLGVEELVAALLALKSVSEVL